MKPSSHVLVLLISVTYMHDVTSAGFFSSGKKNIPTSCSKPPYLGKCQRTNRGWYFDPTVGWCKMFNYGICGGGLNNFQSETQCLQYCRQKRHPKIVCSLPPKIRQCWGSTRQWYFDPSTNSCKMFQSKLCADNANGFSTCAKCLYRCSSTKPETACPSSMQGQNTFRIPGQQSPLYTPIQSTQPIWPTQPGRREATGWLPNQQNSQEPRIPAAPQIWPPPQRHSENNNWSPGWQNPQPTGMPNSQPMWPPHQGRSENTSMFPGGRNAQETGDKNRQTSLPPSQGLPQTYNTSMYAFLN